MGRDPLLVWFCEHERILTIEELAGALENERERREPHIVLIPPAAPTPPATDPGEIVAWSGPPARRVEPFKLVFLGRVLPEGYVVLIAALRSDGFTMTEIALALDVNYGVVSAVLRRLRKVSSPPRTLDDDGTDRHERVHREAVPGVAAPGGVAVRKRGRGRGVGRGGATAVAAARRGGPE